MMVKRYTLNGDRMFPHSEGRWVHGAEYDALAARFAEAELSRDSWKREAELNQQAADESANYAAQLAEAERSIDTLLGMIRHQRDVLRECLPYLNESMAGRRPGRSADDIRASVKALTADSAPAVTPFYGPFPEQSEDERTLRYMLAIRCGEPGELYGDDGELQLGGFPYPIDFRRDSVAEIRRKLDARGMAKLAAQLQAADSATPRENERE